jgi:hypothetical protein
LTSSKATALPYAIRPAGPHRKLCNGTPAFPSATEPYYSMTFVPGGDEKAGLIEVRDGRHAPYGNGSLRHFEFAFGRSAGS